MILFVEINEPLYKWLVLLTSMKENRNIYY